jgi:hypothetical protein
MGRDAALRRPRREAPISETDIAARCPYLKTEPHSKRQALRFLTAPDNPIGDSKMRLLFTALN